MAMSHNGAKKVALLTWAPDENYGTALQCCALNVFISNLGFNVSTIYYVPYRNLNLLLVRYIKRCFKLIFLRLSGKEIVRYEKQKERHERFLSFKNDYYNRTPVVSQDNELIDLAEKFSAFICGSDQIWNPFLFNSHYFLDFVLDNRRKIAYAPSFGTEYIDTSENAKKIIPLVKDFAFISCREESGAKWLSENLGRTVSEVLDPTMLLSKEEWHKIANTAHKKTNQYILCYFLGYNPNYWKSICKFAKSKQLKIVVLPIYRRDFWRKHEIYKDAGPCEFLSLFENASFVCTDSFHGCIFSILFEKNFTPFLRFSKDDIKSQNARVENLLSKFELKERLFSEYKNLESIFFSEIDYCKVNKILKHEREQSIMYLKNALQIVTGGVE